MHLKLTPIKINLLFRGILAFLLLIAVALDSAAQQHGVRVLGSPRQETVLLRWAPASPAVWRLGNEYGYQVERYTILRDGEIPDSVWGVALLNEPLRPKALEVWEPHAGDRYVAIAAECLFDSYFRGITSGGNPHVVYQMYKEEQHRYSFAMYAADQSILTAELSGLYMSDKTPIPIICPEISTPPCSE